MLREIKKEIKLLAVSSTTYGLSNVFQSRHLFNKIFWLFFFAGFKYCIILFCLHFYYKLLQIRCDYHNRNDL